MDFSRLRFFFSSRRRHTRLQGDWSSDVCSSDLKLFPLSQAASLRANIPGTAVVLLINEQGEKEKGRDEWHFSWCSFLWGFGCRGTERRRAERAAAQWSGSQSGRRLPVDLGSGLRSGCQTQTAYVHR